MIWEKNGEKDIKASEITIKFNGRVQQFRRNDKFSEEIFQAVQNQNDIGWYNFIKGRVSKHWKQAQEIYYRFHKKDVKYNGQTWGVKLIEALWSYSEGIWLDRNECKYGEGTQMLNKERQRLRPVVEKLYNTYRGRVSLKDEELFHQGIHEKMKKHPRLIKRWIQIVRTCIKQYSKEKKLGKKRQSRLTRYFYQIQQVQIREGEEESYEANEEGIEVEIIPGGRFRDEG